MKREIAAGEFKAKCLRILDEVAAKRYEVIITKRGKPLVRLTPVAPPSSGIFDRLAGSVEICGDIVGPTLQAWDAEK